MKIAVLHESNLGFFPRFYKSLTEEITENGSEFALFSPNSGLNNKKKLPNQIIWGTRINWHVHRILFKLTGRQDCFSHFSTIDLLRKLSSYRPDIIHLHVILQGHMNLPMFVNYVNKHHIQVIWTFHDCRAFTGLCPFFDACQCDKWLSGCHKCPQLSQYSPSKIDHTSWQWHYRKKWINQIEKLQIVTPSNWLTGLVSNSFLKDFRAMTIYNGIDLKSFSTLSSYSFDDTEKFDGNKIVLGCSICWESRKGLQSFMELIPMLPMDYKIVLIGKMKPEEKEKCELAGCYVVGLTQSVDELIAWYQRADVFVNPTIEDNFPTTNLEALAAGTPVVTYRTGGSPEAIDENTGIVVEKYDIKSLAAAIIKIVENKERYSSEECKKRSLMFSVDQFKKYVDLFSDLYDKNILHQCR